MRPTIEQLMSFAQRMWNEDHVIANQNQMMDQATAETSQKLQDGGRTRKAKETHWTRCLNEKGKLGRLIGYRDETSD